MTYKYIKIVQGVGDTYKIWNVIYKEYVGEIRREMMGRLIHWQSFQYPGSGFSNGCLKEVSKFITTLYSKKSLRVQMTYNSYIEIEKHDEIHKIWNTKFKKYVGEIRRERMGRWMHWQLFSYPNCGFTNGCLKAVSKFITPLYGRKKK